MELGISLIHGIIKEKLGSQKKTLWPRWGLMLQLGQVNHLPKEAPQEGGFTSIHAKEIT